MDTQILPQKPQNFTCKNCEFVSSNKKDYVRHLSTQKHKNRENDTNKIQKNPKKPQMQYECVNCNKIYKYSSGLYRHKKKCLDHENNDNLNHQLSLSKELILEVVKQQQNQIKELTNTIKELIPKVGTNITTTNQKFNIQVFLNEKCKDALNISDFIDSLKITLEDLLFSKTNGISRGITDVLIKGLKELDIYKRPIHCTDIKRDTMYIKDEDKWYKDDNHEMMKNTIVKIADMERTALQQWAIDNPDWMETERKQLDYLTMVRSICEPIENYDNYEKKILKNVGREILVDKK